LPYRTTPSSNFCVEAGRKPRTGLKLVTVGVSHFLIHVEAGRKPRTGLKPGDPDHNFSLSFGRGREKTQNGIETAGRGRARWSGRTSRQGENPERD
jgi:hypothetical protein